MAKTPQRHSLLQQGQLHGELRDQFGFALRQLDSEHLDPARWSFASTAESDHDRTENSCHWVLDAIYREDHNPTRDRHAAANQSNLRRIALNAHNLMPFEGKKRKSLPKRELRAASQSSYLSYRTLGDLRKLSQSLI